MFSKTYKPKGPRELFRLLVVSPGASRPPIPFSRIIHRLPIYSPGASTTPIYSPGSSSTLIYSPGALRNAECSNCKHLLDKITVLEAMLEMYKNPEQHTLNSAALLHEVYNDMGKLDLERPYALSWKPCQGDSLNLPDHRIHKDGDGDASFQLKSDSLPHAHAQTTKTFYKHQDSRIMKAQELNDKVFRTNSDIQDLPSKISSLSREIVSKLSR
ncbi:hypothetical protein Tco_0546198 [Tanacetum coccineum]